MPTIDTIFIDARTGDVIGHMDMPVDRLPASFARATTMHIEEEDWKVIKAEPMMAEEFIRTGRLVLTLEKVLKVPIDKVLFTLPTLCNEIPLVASGSTKNGKHVLELHEDDWRQIEFISLLHRQAIDAEIASIRSIYREASVDNGRFLGFKELHLRQQIPTPLSDALPLDLVTRSFTPTVSHYDGLSYRDVAGCIEGGFAFQVAAALFYGQQVEGLVKVLAIKVPREGTGKAAEIASALESMMATYHLCLVDWCKPQIIPALADRLELFLKR